MDIQNQEAQVMADLNNSKKLEGDELYGQLRNYSTFLDDSVRQSAAALRDINNDEIPRMEREQVDLEFDLHRLEEQNVKYAPTTRELLQSWREFDQAQDERKAMRARMVNIRDQINTHLDENDKEPINMDEVQQLCHIIELKDKQLLLDLIQFKDVQLNQR